MLNWGAERQAQEITPSAALPRTKPRTARHLPEEEAKLRNLANQENACSPLNPTQKKYCVFFWDPEGS